MIGGNLMSKHEMITMLLAGGKGTRLGALTKKVAKPAVSFGGKYRIIDFPLSNCTNSGIEIVGVLTQYESIGLNAYIGSGTIWGFDGNNTKAVLLPPRQKAEGASWYDGTADAIYHNLDFIDKYSPKYVLILSGDHIYKMDYSKMLDFHKKNNADATIAVLKVPLNEASRFGIMNVNEDDSIYQFEEKPANPKSDLASMGIYIFTYDVLKKYLLEDHIDIKDEHDFGKHIIPAMLNNGCKLMAYRFEGYWKDVGTIESLWEANMDLLDGETFDLYDPNWKIYSEDTHDLPHFIDKTGSVKNSLINQGSIIKGHVENSIIFNDVIIEEGATVVDCVILNKVTIKKGAFVYKAIVGPNKVVESNCEINKDGTKAILVTD
jgi:glucose-1-phosphate adenylyltransferase